MELTGESGVAAFGGKIFAVAEADSGVGAEGSSGKGVGIGGGVAATCAGAGFRIKGESCSSVATTGLGVITGLGVTGGVGGEATATGGAIGSGKRGGGTITRRIEAGGSVTVGRNVGVGVIKPEGDSGGLGASRVRAGGGVDATGLGATLATEGSALGLTLTVGSGAVSGAVSGFSTRRLPVCRKVCTGSASAISCSIFISGVAARGGWKEGELMPAGVVRPVGGRRTTPCVAGKVGDGDALASGLGSATTTGVGAGAGALAVPTLAVTGTGLIVGGWASLGAGFDGSAAGFKAGTGSGSVSDFGLPRFQKMSGQGMEVQSYAQLEKMEDFGQRARTCRRETPLQCEVNAKAIRKQDRLLRAPWLFPPRQRTVPADFPVAYNVLSSFLLRDLHVSFTCH
jgi:hypothetical protein